MEAGKDTTGSGSDAKEVVSAVNSRREVIKSAEGAIKKAEATGKSVEECFLEAEMDLVETYKELRRISTGAVIVAKDRYGDRVELGEDNKTRLAAIVVILELVKHLKEKGVSTVNVGVFNDPRVVEEAERVLGMRGRV